MPKTKNGDQPETKTIEQILGPWKKPTQEQRDQLHASWQKLQDEMAAAGVTEEELVADFEEARKRARAQK